MSSQETRKEETKRKAIKVAKVQTWFALARVRALLACSSNGAAVNTMSCVRGTLSFWSPVSLTFADVRTMGTSSVWTSYATLADRFTVQT